MPKPLPPIQSQIEVAQRDLFQTGDIKAVAAHLDVDQSYVGHLLSRDKPDNKSPLYIFERWLWCCDQARTDLGDAHIAMLLTHRARWLPIEENERIPQEVPASMFAFLQAAIAKLPYTEQMQFLDKTYLEIDKFKRGLQFDDLADSEPDENVENINRKRK